MERAVRRALELILTVAGGELGAEAPFVDAGVPTTPPVQVRAARARQILGMDFTADQMAALLEPLEFKSEHAANETLRVNVPGHRRYDVSREEDLVEEIARRHGYDRFPDDLRPFRTSRVPTDVMVRIEDDLRTLLIARGFLEARSAAFSPESGGDVALLNPLSAAEGRLRRALLPGLLRRLEANFNHGIKNVRLFELGTAFAPGGADGLPRESIRLAAVFSGLRHPPHWSGTSGDYDRWDLKGVLEDLAARLGMSVDNEQRDSDGNVLLDAMNAWRVLASGRVMGSGGLVRPDAIDAPAWAGEVWGLEIVLDAQLAVSSQPVYQTLAQFPAVERDIALLVPTSLPSAALEGTIRDAAGPLLERVDVFDVYEDERLGPDRRSIAFRLRFQAPDRTLVDEEVDAVVARILKRLSEEHHVERRA
jgi:phenylalanyl-tRNA synthetase beta chain